MNKKYLITWATFLGATAVFFLINWLSSNAFIRIDLTKDRIYSLSAGTKEVLDHLDSPVTLRFYSSQNNESMPLPLKAYIKRTDELLSEFKANAHGQLMIEKIDTQPDSDEADTANLDGVQAQNLDTGEHFYAGLVAIRGKQKYTLSSLVMQRERLLEYDIVRAITRTAIVTKPKIGILSSLPVFGKPGSPALGILPTAKQIFVSELQQDFDVVKVSTNAKEIDDQLKVLLIIHPKDLSETTEFAIDQFVLRGGKVIALLDPYAYFDTSSNESESIADSKSSNLDHLTRAWGVNFQRDKTVADLQFMQAKNNPGLPNLPTVLYLNEAAFNSTDITTSELGQMLLVYSGAFTNYPIEDVKQTVLIHSSTYSDLIEKSSNLNKGEQLIQEIHPSGQTYALAIRVEGQFNTAFPNGPPLEKVLSIGEISSKRKSSISLKSDVEANSSEKIEIDQSEEKPKNKPKKSATESIPQQEHQADLEGMVSNKDSDASTNYKPKKKTKKAAPQSTENLQTLIPSEPSQTLKPFIRHAQANSSVVLIGDSDFINDDISFQTQEETNQWVVYPKNGNMAFLQALIDQYTGDASLASLRLRQSATQPFTVIQEIEANAQKAYIGRIKTLEEDLQEARQSIISLQKNKFGNDSAPPLDSNHQDEFNTLKQTATEKRIELKRLRKELKADSKVLQFRAKVINILFMPILLTLIALFLYLHRKNIHKLS